MKLYRRFLISLGASWVVSPLAILMAQAWGMANRPEVLLTLLAIAACSPFQMFINEALAPTLVSERNRALERLAIQVIAIQIGACILALGLSTQYPFARTDIVLCAVLLGAATYLSFRISIIFYRMMMSEGLHTQSIVAISATPGLINALLYTLYSWFGSQWESLALPVMLSTLLLPSLVQYGQIFILKARLPKEENLSIKDDDTTQRFPILGYALLLAVLAATSTWAKSEATLLDSNYSGLILVAINSVLGLINTYTRTIFLQSGTSYARQFALVAGSGALGLALILQTDQKPAAALCLCLAAQLAIATTIDVARARTQLT